MKNGRLIATSKSHCPWCLSHRVLGRSVCPPPWCCSKTPDLRVSFGPSLQSPYNQQLQQGSCAQDSDWGSVALDRLSRTALNSFGFVLEACMLLERLTVCLTELCVLCFVQQQKAEPAPDHWQYTAHPSNHHAAVEVSTLTARVHCTVAEQLHLSEAFECWAADSQPKSRPTITFLLFLPNCVCVKSS